MDHVYFSPRGGCENALTALIGTANHEVLILIFSLTSKPIAAALGDAVKRGVSVKIVADSSFAAQPGSRLQGLKDAGATVLLDSAHKLMHDKILISDQRAVATGSFNFTYEAEHANAENLIVLRNPGMVRQYVDNFNLHAGHSQPL